jgi:hypothetical protein
VVKKFLKFWNKVICWWYGHDWVRIDKKWQKYKCFRCYYERKDRPYPLIYVDGEPTGNIIEKNIKERFG